MRNLRICLHSYLAKEIIVIWAGVLVRTLQRSSGQEGPFRRVKELELPASIPSLRTKWRCGLRAPPPPELPVQFPLLVCIASSCPAKKESLKLHLFVVCVSVLEARVPRVHLSFHHVGPRD